MQPPYEALCIACSPIILHCCTASDVEPRLVLWTRTTKTESVSEREGRREREWEGLSTEEKCKRGKRERDEVSMKRGDWVENLINSTFIAFSLPPYNLAPSTWRTVGEMGEYAKYAHGPLTEKLLLIPKLSSEGFFFPRRKSSTEIQWGDKTYAHRQFEKLPLLCNWYSKLCFAKVFITRKSILTFGLVKTTSYTFYLDLFLSKN